MADTPVDSPETSESPEKSENETQRKFREALEQKNAKAKKAHGENHLGNQGVGMSHNDKSKRQFRRKSGG